MSRLSRILSETGLALKKGLGQNFLVNQGALEKIATGSGCGPASFVLEIGSGLGNLTELLARQAGRIPRKLYATASSPLAGVIGAEE